MPTLTHKCESSVSRLPALTRHNLKRGGTTRGRRKVYYRSATTGGFSSGTPNLAVEIAARIEVMPVEQVRELYHDLVDKRPDLSSIERFEFERVKARLDAEDFDAEQAARGRAWERRRAEVLDSIEDLLDRLRQSLI